MAVSRDARTRRRSGAPRPSGVLAGEGERIFSFLPEEVVRNMKAGSESAAVWNAFYPFASRGLSAQAWFEVPRRWGSMLPPIEDDTLTPFFWGWNVQGEPLPGLAEAAESIAGRQDRLEVDLFLRGARTLVAIEAKVGAAPGRCGRYDGGRCPEVHGAGGACRYWEDGPQRFAEAMDFGQRPGPGEESPPCAIHYQLARTLLLVQRLAAADHQVPYLCLLVPGRQWSSLMASWLDFAGRVRDEAMWRRLRVLAWEDLKSLGNGRSPARSGAPVDFKP